MAVLMKNKNLSAMRDKIARIEDDPKAERFLRVMVAKVAGSCPVKVLKHLAECVASCRADELRSEAERN